MLSKPDTRCHSRISTPSSSHSFFMAVKAKARYAHSPSEVALKLIFLPRTLIVRLISTAQTGFVYTRQRLRQGPKLSAVKYDPVGAWLSFCAKLGFLTQPSTYLFSATAGPVRRKSKNEEIVTCWNRLASAWFGRYRPQVSFVDCIVTVPLLKPILEYSASFFTQKSLPIYLHQI